MIHTSRREETVVNLLDSQVSVYWGRDAACPEVVEVEVLENKAPPHAGYAIRCLEQMERGQQLLQLRFHSLVALNDFIKVCEQAREGFSPHVFDSGRLPGQKPVKDSPAEREYQARVKLMAAQDDYNNALADMWVQKGSYDECLKAIKGK